MNTPRPRAPHPRVMAAADDRTVSRQLARHLRIISELLDERGRPIQADELAERIGVSLRTMERDIEQIRAAGLPLHGRGGRKGGIWLDVSREHPEVRLDVEQVLGLLLALGAHPQSLSGPMTQTTEALHAQLEGPRLF